MKHLSLCLLLVGISACSYLPVTETPNRNESTSGSNEGSSVPGDVAGSSGGAATASAELLHQSRASQATGHYQRAASDIERALRIEPRNPYLWLELGKIRLAAGNKQQAAALAQKAMSMTGNDASARTAAQRLLDDANTY